MKRHLFLVLSAFAALFLAACATTRSISDSGYRGSHRSTWGSEVYRGELSEFDIVGGPAATNITETDIQAALTSHPAIKLQRSEPVLVIQSGALTPDDEFLRELDRYFPSAPFMGQPPQSKEAYSARLRLAAAQGGYKHILCYWGVLEASQEDQATKTVSWVPIAGRFVPDQTQKMRIRLKAIVLDVATGRWTMITPLPVEDERLSAKLNRESSDQKQVARLKQAGYRALVTAVNERCGA